MVEQERWSAEGGFTGAIGDGGDLEVRGDRFIDPSEKLPPIEVAQEIGEVGVHRWQLADGIYPANESVKKSHKSIVCAVRL